MAGGIFSRIKIISSISHIQAAWALRPSIISQQYRWEDSFTIHQRTQWWGNKIKMKECLNIGWVLTFKYILNISRWAYHPLIKWFQYLLCNTIIRVSRIKISQWCQLRKDKQAHSINSNLCSSTHQLSPSFIMLTSKCQLLLFNNTNRLLLSLNHMVVDLHKVRQFLQVQTKEWKIWADHVVLKYKLVLL